MMKILNGALAILAIGTAVPAHAKPPELQPEKLTVETLDDVMQPHWVWVNDMSFERMADGRAYLIDGDTGRVLGMVGGDYGHSFLLLSPDGKTFAVPSTHMSRGSRGERTEVITFYKTNDLKPGQELKLPPKRFSGAPFFASAPTIDGGRFTLIYNFTPAQSLTVVDLVNRKVVEEVDTPGCALSYPTSAHDFFMLCSDGSLQSARIDSSGKVTLGGATKPVIDQDDPVTEKAVWDGKAWLFFTFSGKVDVITQTGGKLPSITKTWSLTGPEDKGWRPGGSQPAAYHSSSGRLYVLMHRGGPGTHKDPGTEVWVYDAAKGVRLKRIPLAAPVSSVAVSQDDNPLLYLAAMGNPALRIYDPTTGKLLRKVGELGGSLAIIQPSPVTHPTGKAAQ